MKENDIRWSPHNAAKLRVAAPLATWATRHHMMDAEKDGADGMAHGHLAMNAERSAK
jgi:hypothetical protein